jgi:hypothetical protein
MRADAFIPLMRRHSPASRECLIEWLHIFRTEDRLTEFVEKYLTSQEVSRVLVLSQFDDIVEEKGIHGPLRYSIPGAPCMFAEAAFLVLAELCFAWVMEDTNTWLRVKDADKAFAVADILDAGYRDQPTFLAAEKDIDIDLASSILAGAL